MSAWHLEVRADNDGRTLIAADMEVHTVDEIQAVRSGDTLGILRAGETVAVGYPTVAEAQDGNFSLYRWPLDRSKKPVITKIS